MKRSVSKVAAPGEARDAVLRWGLGGLFVLQVALSLSLYSCIRTLQLEVREATLIELRGRPPLERWRRPAHDADLWGAPMPPPARTFAEAPPFPPSGSASRFKRRTSADAAQPYKPTHELMEDNALPSSFGTTITPNGATTDKGSWIVSMSKIPVDTVQSFCRQHCLPGAKGEAGSMGPPGVRGVEGPRGERGDRGYPGEQGPKGPKGDLGREGRAGLDGNDGVPGEPGLDGVPGRNGNDGSPGTDGKPGTDGIPGKPGTDGKDGRPGLGGPPGASGPPGVRGLPGPRGKAGTNGTPGHPGTPGICVYRYKVNGQYANASEFLIPPSIPGSGLLAPQRPIIVEEGKNVRLRCAATGHPIPTVVWSKVPGGVIPLGSWQVNYVTSHTLNITRITREHMGEYMCIASNGVPPAANQTFRLEVHFSPFIHIHQQVLGVILGSTARLECEVEAFPEPVLYWEGPGGRAIEAGDKYRVDSTDPDGYKITMRLNVTRMGSADFGQYKCYAKNSMGLVIGDFHVHERDPRLATPPPLQGGRGAGVSFGNQSPKLQSEEDLCPPQPQCPTCPANGTAHAGHVTEMRCSSAAHDWSRNLHSDGLELPNGTKWLGYPRNRTLNCKLYVVGKAVYLVFTNEALGAWMRDPMPATEAAGEQYWVTSQHNTQVLYEYANKTAFRERSGAKEIRLPQPFVGNSHVVYNGKFFYASTSGTLVRLDLQKGDWKEMAVPSLGEKLYKGKYNSMDLNVDDNGLWVIYSLKDSNNTVVMKMDAFSPDLNGQYAWNISINNHLVGEMFIVCGVLYVVDSAEDNNSNIRFALDLYRNMVLTDVELSFTNPFGNTTMLGYNHRHKELYSWDKGNQLTYPVRYHEIDDDKAAKEDKGEPEASARVETGVDVLDSN